MNQSTEIEVKNLDHLGLVAGIIDEIGIVEIINEQVSIERGEIVTAGQVVKAIILNGLGFVSRSLYLFTQFFGSSLPFMLNQQTRCQDNILLTQKFRKFLKP
jgi:transposase